MLDRRSNEYQAERAYQRMRFCELYRRGLLGPNAFRLSLEHLGYMAREVDETVSEMDLEKAR